MEGSNYCGQAVAGQAFAPGTVYWGVDSTTHVDEPPPGQPGATFFERVKAKAGKSPSFWGRYVGSTPHTEYNLTTSEIAYLARNKCRILLIYNGHADPIRYPTLDGPMGLDAATIAIREARKLGVPETTPATVWIYCDVEGSQIPTSDFFAQWFNTMMTTSRYGGGVYTDPTKVPINQAYCSAYVDRIPCELLYSNQTSLNPPCDWNRKKFDPKRPACNPAKVIPTVIYQYQLECDVDGSTQHVDLDLANYAGFGSMWVPGDWEPYRIDLHNDVNNQGITAAPALERLPSGRLVAILTIARIPNDVAGRVGAYVSADGGQTWAAPVEMPETGRVPATIVERGGHTYCFALGSTIRTVVQAKFDTTALAWVNFGTQQSPIYWRLWYTAPGTGTQVIRFPRAARSADRTQAGITVLHSSPTLSQFVPMDVNGNAGTAETIPTGGSSGPLMLRWVVGGDAQAARMRPIDQLQYVNGQLFFDPAQPQFVDLWKRSGGVWTLDSTYTVDSLDKLTTP